MMSHAGTVQLELKVEHDVINPSQVGFKSIVENAISKNSRPDTQAFSSSTHT